MQIGGKLQKNCGKHNWNFQIRKIIGGKKICRGGPQAHPPLQMDLQMDFQTYKWILRRSENPFVGRVGLWAAPTNEFPGAVEGVARPWKWIFTGEFIFHPWKRGIFSSEN